jgi:hypothetical protein
MLSRGSTIWSFTDCLVMVGGWVTATEHTETVRATGPAGDPAWGMAKIRSFRSHLGKQV